MASFGWSAACVVEAIKFANTARKALKNLRGAASQYQDAVEFLASLEKTLADLKPHVETSTDGARAEAIKDHLSRIDTPWKEFKLVLEKYEKSLALDLTRSKSRQAPGKVKRALKKLDEAVRKLREVIMQPILAINCNLTLSLIESIKMRQDEPWTDTQVKKLIDAFQVAEKPVQLPEDRSSLKEAGAEQHISNSEQLEHLVALRESICNIEQILQEPTSLETLKAGFQAISQLFQKTENMHKGMTSTMYEHKESLQQFQNDLEARLNTSSRHVETDTEARAQFGQLLSFAYGVIFASFTTGALVQKRADSTTLQLTPTTLKHRTPRLTSLENRVKASPPPKQKDNVASKLERPMSAIKSTKGKSQVDRHHCRERPMKNSVQEFCKKDNMARHRRPDHRQDIPQRKAGDGSLLDRLLYTSSSSVPEAKSASIQQTRVKSKGVGITLDWTSIAGLAADIENVVNVK